MQGSETPENPFDALLDIAGEYGIQYIDEVQVIEDVDRVVVEDPKEEPSFASRIDALNTHLELLSSNHATIKSFLKSCKPCSTDLILTREAQQNLVAFLPLTLSTINNLSTDLSKTIKSNAWSPPTYIQDFITATTLQLSASDKLKTHLQSKLTLQK